MLNTDGDLPRHLLMGKYVLETGIPPTQEIFSYPYEGRTYVPHEWLAGVIYYLSYLFLGLNGVVLLAGILIASTFTIIYARASTQNEERLLTFLLVLLGAVVTSIHWLTRPHLFSMLFLAIWLIWMERLSRAEPIRLWQFPALMLLWGNIHAESISGFLVLIAYIGGWIWQYFFSSAKPSLITGRTLVIITVFTFLASLINPSGILAWASVSNYLNNNYLMSRITETRPPDFTQLEYLPLLALLLISVFKLVIQRKQFTPSQMFLMTGFGAMSLLSARNSHLFGVVAPFVICFGLRGIKTIQPLKNIEQIFARAESRVSGKTLQIATMIILSITLIIGPWRRINQFDPSVFPVDAVQWLKSNPPSGRMFNDFNWGGYILFHLWPQQKVFIESQTDTTGEVTRKYEAVVTLQDDWDTVFRDYEITWAIIPVHSPLAMALASDSEWITAYQDSVAIIYYRK